MSNSGFKFGRVALHFGFPKTGTTNLQFTLDRNRDQLLSSGFLAYAPGVLHAELGAYFMRSPNEYTYFMARRIEDVESCRSICNQYFFGLKKWLLDIPPCKNIVFSYEGFADLDERTLKGFKRFCYELAPVVDVIIYVRSPLSYAQSAISQSIKHGIVTDFLIPRWRFSKKYSSIYEQIVSVFGRERVFIKPFSSDALVNGNVIDDFLKTLDAPANILAELVRMESFSLNKSISDNGYMLGREIIREFSDRGIKICESEYDRQIGKYLADVAGNAIRLDETMVDKVLQETEEERKYLKKEYDISFEHDIDAYSIKEGSASSAGDSQLFRSLAEFFVNSLIGASRKVELSSGEVVLVSAGIDGGAGVGVAGEFRFNVDLSFGVDLDNLEAKVEIRPEDDGRNIPVWCGNGLGVGRKLRKGQYTLSFVVDAMLPEGKYHVSLALGTRHKCYLQPLVKFMDIVSFESPPQTADVAFKVDVLNIDVACFKKSKRVVTAVGFAYGNMLAVNAVNKVKAGTLIEIPVSFFNESGEYWVSTFHNPINISYHWLDSAGEVVIPDGIRTELPVNQVKPGKKVDAFAKILVPDVPGKYTLLLTMVQEGNAWFETRGFNPARLEFLINK